MSQSVITSKFGVETISLTSYAVNGCTIYGQMTRFNNMVSLTGSWFNTNGIENVHILENLPERFRPQSQRNGSGMTVKADGTVLAGVPELYPDGYLREGSTTTTKKQGSFAFVYPVN